MLCTRAQGLAYSVSGGFDTPVDHMGLFQAGGETASPAKFLAGLQRVLQVPVLIMPACLLAGAGFWPSTVPGKGLTRIKGPLLAADRDLEKTCFCFSGVRRPHLQKQVLLIREWLLMSQGPCGMQNQAFGGQVGS